MLHRLVTPSTIPGAVRRGRANGPRTFALPLSCRSYLALAAPIQTMSRQMPSAMNRTTCEAFMPLMAGGEGVVKQRKRGQNGPTRIASTVTMKHGPIQPQAVVMKLE